MAWTAPRVREVELPSLKQIRALVAVGEEGSFTAAARREKATQSGISQHVAALEAELGVSLFNRSSDGVALTGAGRRYYEHCVQALSALDRGRAEVGRLAGQINGELSVGLMPTFTRAALAPALDRFTRDYPGVTIRLTEAYSGTLTESVLAGELDFALVPAAPPVQGLASELISRDREFLVSRAGEPGANLKPVRLSELAPLKLIVPGRGNARRDNLEIYLETHGVRIARLLELDAMIGTLEMVARTDWVTILPGLICIADVGQTVRCLNPLVSPSLHAEYVLIKPARRQLSRQAELFISAIRDEVSQISEHWARILARVGQVSPGGPVATAADRPSG